ncbi:hypothetical protein UG55_101013 [Frankia sp. EI5c]|uniref:roadblock/LC7 domain-containing protein n=1 Tax=Frankia sp. EI5c TaxID=683316 RepID=UPI0007C2EB90|nr:roadblock/LC7 domain-containing protein [Frankia sp. EI5c]OAA26999.1 hypothetical protein UG55_101013 [Frankia sp. EI5c]
MSRQPDLSFLLERLRESVPDILCAVVLSADGLLLATSSGIDRTAADQLAAVASGFDALARGAARQHGWGQVNKTMVDMENGYLFITAVGHSACLAVSSTADADVGQIAYEMAHLVNRAGRLLTPELRNQMRAALPS